MKLVKVNSDLLVNPDRVDYVEQKKDGIIISIGGRIIPIKTEDDLKDILMELYAQDNLWGAQHWRG